MCRVAQADGEMGRWGGKAAPKKFRPLREGSGKSYRFFWKQEASGIPVLMGKGRQQLHPPPEGR